ncbi:M56 family metallopeptidase [Saccharopolyspora tripterygii]
MRTDRFLWILVAAAAATYPAIGLASCTVAALTAHRDARALGFEGNPVALAAMLLILIGAVAVGNALRTTLVGMRQTHRFHTWVTQRRVPTPGPVAASAHDLGYRFMVIETDHQIAVTTGLLRPFVVISTGLAESLNDAELRAVLTHERAHARRKDPLRALVGQMLAAHLWFLPAAQDVRTRARREYELAADRHSADHCGRRALAGALLRITSPTAITPEFVAPFAESDLLDARVAQLESGHPPRPPRVSPMRSALTVAGALAFLTTVTGAWLFMLLACPCAAT